MSLICPMLRYIFTMPMPRDPRQRTFYKVFIMLERSKTVGIPGKQTCPYTNTEGNMFLKHDFLTLFQCKGSVVVSHALPTYLLSVLCSTILLLCRALSTDTLHDYAPSAVASSSQLSSVMAASTTLCVCAVCVLDT